MQFKLTPLLLVVTSGLQVVSTAAGESAADVAQDRQDTTTTSWTSPVVQGPQWPASPAAGIGDGSDEQQRHIQQPSALHVDFADRGSHPRVSETSDSPCISGICAKAMTGLQATTEEHYMKRLVKITPKRVAGFVVKCVRKAFRCLVNDGARQMGLPDMPSNRVGAEPSRRRSDDDGEAQDQGQPAGLQAHIQTKRLVKLMPKRVANFVIKCVRRTFRCLEATEARQLGVHKMSSNRIKPSEEHRDERVEEPQQRHKRELGEATDTFALNNQKRLVKITPKRAAGFAVKCLRKVFRCVVAVANYDLGEPPMRTNRVGASGRRDVSQGQELQDRSDSAGSVSSWSLDKKEERHRIKRLVTPKRAANLVMKCVRKVGRCFMYLDRGMSGQGPAPSTRVSPVSFKPRRSAPSEEAQRQTSKRTATREDDRLDAVQLPRSFNTSQRRQSMSSWTPATISPQRAEKRLVTPKQVVRYDHGLPPQPSNQIQPQPRVVKKVKDKVKKIVKAITRPTIDPHNPATSFKQVTHADDADEQNDKRMILDWRRDDFAGPSDRVQLERRGFSQTQRSFRDVNETWKRSRRKQCHVRRYDDGNEVEQHDERLVRTVAKGAIRTAKHFYRGTINKWRDCWYMPPVTSSVAPGSPGPGKREELDATRPTYIPHHGKRGFEVRREYDIDDGEQHSKRLVKTLAKGVRKVYRYIKNRYRVNSHQPAIPPPKVTPTRRRSETDHSEQEKRSSRSPVREEGSQNLEHRTALTDELATLPAAVQLEADAGTNQQSQSASCEAIESHPPRLKHFQSLALPMKADSTERLPMHDKSNSSDVVQSVQQRLNALNFEDQQQLPMRFIQSPVQAVAKALRACAWCAYPFSDEHPRNRPSNCIKHDDHSDRRRDIQISKRMANSLGGQDPELANRFFKTAVDWAAKGLRGCISCFRRCRDDQLFMDPVTNKVKPLELEGRSQCVHTGSPLDHEEHNAREEQHHQYTKRFFKTALTKLVRGIRGCMRCFREQAEDALGTPAPTNRVEPLTSARQRRTVRLDYDHDQQRQPKKRVFRDVALCPVKGLRKVTGYLGNFAGGQILRKPITKKIKPLGVIQERFDDLEEKLAKRLLRTAVKAVWRSGRKVGKTIVNRWRVNGFQRPYTSNVAPSADADRKRGESGDVSPTRANGFSIHCPLGSCYKPPPRDVKRLKPRAWGVQAAVVARHSQTIKDDDDQRQDYYDAAVAPRNETISDLKSRGILGAFKKGYNKGQRREYHPFDCGLL